MVSGGRLAVSGFFSWILVENYGLGGELEGKHRFSHSGPGKAVKALYVTVAVTPSSFEVFPLLFFSVT
jgi:hypothetical protein